MRGIVHTFLFLLAVPVCVYLRKLPQPRQQTPPARPPTVQQKRQKRWHDGGVSRERRTPINNEQSLPKIRALPLLFLVLKAPRQPLHYVQQLLHLRYILQRIFGRIRISLTSRLLPSLRANRLKLRKRGVDCWLTQRKRSPRVRETETKSDVERKIQR